MGDSNAAESHTIATGGRPEYGSCLEDFSRVTGAAKAMQLEPGNPLHHPLYMILVKMSRLVHQPGHADSTLDIKGYATTYEMTWSELQGKEVVR